MNRFMVSKLFFSLLIGGVAFGSHNNNLNRKGDEKKRFTASDVRRMATALSTNIRQDLNVTRNHTVSRQSGVSSQVFKNHVNSKLMIHDNEIKNHDERFMIHEGKFMTHEEEINNQQVDFDLLKDELEEIWRAVGTLEKGSASKKNRLYPRQRTTDMLRNIVSKPYERKIIHQPDVNDK